MDPLARSRHGGALVLLLALGAAVAGCSLIPGASAAPPRDQAVRALPAQQALWREQHLDDYRFTITRQCFCPGTDPIDVTVVDGVVTTLTKAGQAFPPLEVQGMPKTVDELFAVVAAQAHAAAMTVEWDPTFGFPASIQVDSIANAIDDEFGYRVTNFHPAS